MNPINRLILQNGVIRVNHPNRLDRIFLGNGVSRGNHTNRENGVENSPCIPASAPLFFREQ